MVVRKVVLKKKLEKKFKEILRKLYTSGSTDVTTKKLDSQC